MFFSFLFPQRLQAAQFVFCQHADRNELVRRSTLDLDIDAAYDQPARCSARTTSIDNGLEDNLKKKTFFAIRDGWRSFVFVLCTPEADCFFFYHTPRQHPPHDMV